MLPIVDVWYQDTLTEKIKNLSAKLSDLSITNPRWSLNGLGKCDNKKELNIKYGNIYILAWSDPIIQFSLLTESNLIWSDPA